MSSKRAFVSVTVAFGLLLSAATSGAVTEAKPSDLSSECIDPNAAKALARGPAAVGAVGVFLIQYAAGQQPLQQP